MLFKGETYPLKVKELQSLMVSRDKVLAELKENLALAQQSMKHFADRHRRELPYEPRNWVFLKLQPYRMKLLVRKLNESLGHGITAPFRSLRS